MSGQGICELTLRQTLQLHKAIHSHCSGRFISHLFQILEIFELSPDFSQSANVPFFRHPSPSWEYRIHLYSPRSSPIKLPVPALPLSLNGVPHSTDCNFGPSENLPREYWLRNGLLRNMDNISLWFSGCPVATGYQKSARAPWSWELDARLGYQEFQKEK